MDETPRGKKIDAASKRGTLTAEIIGHLKDIFVINILK